MDSVVLFIAVSMQVPSQHLWWSKKDLQPLLCCQNVIRKLFDVFPKASAWHWRVLLCRNCLKQWKHRAKEACPCCHQCLSQMTFLLAAAVSSGGYIVCHPLA